MSPAFAENPTSDDSNVNRRGHPGLGGLVRLREADEAAPYKSRRPVSGGYGTGAGQTAVLR